MHSVTKEYVDSVSKAAAVLWRDVSADSVPHVIAPELSFRDSFLAMTQADVLDGSGSSLPMTAALVSGEPLFFNHVAKHGYLVGAEILADGVDMSSDGTILDSIRRTQSHCTSACARRAGGCVDPTSQVPLRLLSL